jgi:hypothetical protein
MSLDDKPYMNDTEIFHLLKYINRDVRMLEIGGGGSTVFLSKLVKRLVTVEHNKNWSSKLWNLLGKKRPNWSLHIAEPNFPQQHPFQPAQPGQFDRYINHISNINETFDVILIDGRDRVRSVHASLDKLKMGGYMIIHDFWNRPKYHSVLNITNLKLVSEENSFPQGEIKDTIVVLKKI